MDDKKTGTLLLTLKKSEMLVISDGKDEIHINFCDKFKQPLGGRVRIKSSKRYDIRRRPSGGLSA